MAKNGGASDASKRDANGHHHNQQFGISLALACGGALLFSLPMLMTMEMWWLGFYLNGYRLAIFMLLVGPLLFALSYYAGYKETSRWLDDALDACIAYAVGFVVAMVTLSLFAVLRPGMSVDELIGKVALLAIPGSIGAMLGRDQLGIHKGKQEERRSSTYCGTLFLMGIGGMFVSFSLAATEEIILIAYRMTAWHACILACVCVLMTHIFVLAVDSRSQTPQPPGQPFWKVFLRFTVIGYALTLTVSAYMLWTFGRLDNTGIEVMLKEIIVLGFPGALGAGASRLIMS